MQESKIFIDFDGVIFDTEARIVKRKNFVPELSWDEFFKEIDWFKLLDEAKIINNSVNYILEKQKSNKNMTILTKAHTLNEMIAKTEVLRDYKITVPIMFVPPRVSKTSIYLPSSGEILIDDSLKNLEDWKSHGGIGIYFSEEKISSDFKTIKSLKKVL